MKEIISKYIGQLSYIPTMAMYESMFRTAVGLADSKEFENWRAKRTPDTALLFNNEDKYSLQVDPNNLTFSTENSEVGNRIDVETIRYASLFLEPADVEKIQRVAVRRIGIYEINAKYSDYVGRFFDAFYKDRDLICSLIADKIEDTMYVIESIKDGYKIRMRLAPLKPGQFEEFFPQEEFTPKKPLKNDTYVLVDLDVYGEFIDSTNYATGIDSLSEIFKQNSEAYSQIVKMIKEKTT